MAGLGFTIDELQAHRHVLGHSVALGLDTDPEMSILYARLTGVATRQSLRNALDVVYEGPRVIPSIRATPVLETKRDILAAISTEVNLFDSPTQILLFL